MNVSHIIHDLSFGPKYPGIHNPLDGTSRIVHKGSGTFKYYIKVIYIYSVYIYLLFSTLKSCSISDSRVFGKEYC